MAPLLLGFAIRRPRSEVGGHVPSALLEDMEVLSPQTLLPDFQPPSLFFSIQSCCSFRILIVLFLTVIFFISDAFG